MYTEQNMKEILLYALIHTLVADVNEGMLSMGGNLALIWNARKEWQQCHKHFCPPGVKVFLQFTVFALHLNIHATKDIGKQILLV